MQPPFDCQIENVVSFIYDDFGKAVISKAHHVIGRWDIANEIAQEVFIKLWQKAPKLESREHAHAWLFRVCHNTSIDYLRSAVSRREKFSYDSGNEQPSADFNFETKAFCRQILGQFSKKEAEMIGYVIFDEMTHDETANVVGVSKKTVTRSMKKINARLAAIGKNYEPQ